MSQRTGIQRSTSSIPAVPATRSEGARPSDGPSREAGRQAGPPVGPPPAGPDIAAKRRRRSARPCGVFKRGNDYASSFPDYDATPKAVIAAVAFSLAVRLTGEDSWHRATATLRTEWVRLHQAGVVPQRPPRDAGVRRRGGAA